MPNLALSWRQATVLASGLVAIAIALRYSGRPRLCTWSPVFRESAVIAALYALWQLAGSFSLIGSGGALARGRWILRSEHAWHLPSETDVQRLVLPHPLLAQFCNLYYASMHFACLGALLFWLFLRHRDDYRRVRTTIVLLTGSCLLIQLVPVAPPRLFPQYGFVDLAERYGQSVYGGGFDADQLSAMPSVHVGWAVLVGLVAVRVSTSRWRWLTLLHPLITIFVVIATANHFWLDGIVAIALLIGAEATQNVAARAARRLRAEPQMAAGL